MYIHSTVCVCMYNALYCMYVHVCTTDQDTNGAEESVIVREVSSFQRLKCTQECYIWGGKRCPVGEVSSVQECLQRMNYHMDHSHVSTVCVSVEQKNWGNCIYTYNAPTGAVRREIGLITEGSVAKSKPTPLVFHLSSVYQQIN